MIILVRPSVPENVGFVARAMKAFGFEKLTIVSPVFEWDPEGPAWKTACGAQEMLVQAERVDHVENAVASYHRVIGFSRRKHDFARPQSDITTWSVSYQEQYAFEKTALVFGPENFGLSNEDKRHCDQIVQIPLYHPALSLNLAQSVTVVLYEITRSGLLAAGAKESVECMATHGDVQRVVTQLTSLLEITHFFKKGRKERQIEIMRNLIFRCNLTKHEYDTVMGILSALNRKSD